MNNSLREIGSKRKAFKTLKEGKDTTRFNSKWQTEERQRWCNIWITRGLRSESQQVRKK